MDNESLVVGGMIYYELVDPYKFYMAVQDTDDSLQGLVMAKIARYVCRVNYEDCTEEAVRRAVTGPIRAAAKKWGLRVIDFALNELAKTGNGVHWHAGEGLSLDIPEEE
jgi:regulator of protease activity HflC (stomatin/prohibitin superfamily)